MEEIHDVFHKQKVAVYKGLMRPLKKRHAMLKALASTLRQNEPALYEAIRLDFGKSEFETYATELALIYKEINLCLKNLDDWTAVKKVPTDLANFPGSSRIYPEPYGVVLVIGAWNYPYQLSLAPMVPALAAGNTVILKPSELAPHTAALMASLINAAFPAEVFYVQEGGVELTTSLLELPFDKIFFTGSPRIGKLVMAAAARNLTPVTLELGGKSPCIVMDDADLPMAAKRISWGKFLNAGQTCIAPDYLLVHERVYGRFLKLLAGMIQKNLGPDPSASEAYVRIINRRNFDRIAGLIDPAKVYFGGETRTGDLYIAPTILSGVEWDDPSMQEEIFGPVLPVIRFNDLDHIIGKIQGLPKPLSLYLFSRSRKTRRKVIENISFGGGCINDTIMHIANPSLPFGGVGNSGMGAYHGEAGFRAFTHYKSVLVKTNLFEPPVKYPPYTSLKRWLIRQLTA